MSFCFQQKEKPENWSNLNLIQIHKGPEVQNEITYMNTILENIVSKTSIIPKKI